MKITSSTKLIKSITVRIYADELYLNYLASIRDVVNDSEGEITLSDHAEELDAILKGDAEEIRQLFNRGYTMMLVPGAMEEIEEADDVTIIVFSKDFVVEVKNHDVQY